MGAEMTLREVVTNLSAFDEGATIYASEPWNEGSASMVEREPEQGGLPPRATQKKMAYFLEVDLARSIVAEWIAATGVQDESDISKRLIEYATYDA